MPHKLSDLGVEFQKAKLDNGVPIFLFQRKGMPIAMRVVFFAGARFDKIAGTAHFLEHLLVAGTEKYPTKDKLAEKLERIGGDFNANTNVDFLRLNVNIAQKEDLSIGLEVLNEMLYRSLFEDKTIENERGSVLSELSQYEENPYFNLNLIFNPLIYNKSPRNNNVIGTKESINKIAKEDILDHKKAFLSSGRMTVIVSGDLSMSECLPKFNEFLSYGDREPRFENPEILEINRDKWLDSIPFRDNKQVYVRMGFRIPAFEQGMREIEWLGLAADILGSGRTSRFLKELRYKRGLVYNVGAGVSSNVDTGIFSAWTSVKRENFDEVVKIMIEELKKLSQEGLSQSELDFTKSASVKSVVNTMQTSQSWLNPHEYEAVFNSERARTLDFYMNEIESITLEEVNLALRKYLHKDNFYLSFCGIEKTPNVSW